MKLDSFKGKRIVCFDFGLKRIGFAVSDELLITTRPFKTYSNDKNLYNEIKSDFENLNVGLIVIGYPFDDKKEKSEIQIEIEIFREKLSKLFDIELVYQDENYTSIEAEKTMISAGKKKKDRRVKENKDKMAAAIILKQFLEENG